MNIKAKVLIVSLILLLSLGPLIYFFGSRPDIEIFPEEEEEPIFLSFSGNVTGTIVDIQPFISYVGTALSNDEAQVRSILSTISSNYTVTTTLNPYGEGYRYEITLFLKNSSEAKQTGFRLYFRLSKFFINPGIPVVVGEILLPPSFRMGDDMIYAEEGTTVPAALLYSQDVNTMITIYCPEIITSHNYNLTRVPKICTDLSEGYRYGLSMTDIAAYSAKQAVEMTLTIEKVVSISFSGQCLGNLSTDTVQAVLPEGASALTLVGTENTTVLVFLNKTDSLSIEATRTALESLGVSITSEYKSGIVDLPDRVTLLGQDYDLFLFDKVAVEMGIDEQPSTIIARVIFTRLFGEIENVEVERLAG